MAEDKDESQEKTQDPTSRRLEKAREDGKVVSSKEMFVFTILTVGVILMYIFPPLIEDFLKILQGDSVDFLYEWHELKHIFIDLCICLFLVNLRIDDQQND